MQQHKITELQGFRPAASQQPGGEPEAARHRRHGRAHRRAARNTPSGWRDPL